MTVIQALQARCNDTFGQQRAHADTHPATGPAELAAELAVQLGGGLQQALAIREQGVAFVGQAQAVGSAVQQAHTAGRLQPGQRTGDLAHRHIALAGCGRQGAQLGNTGEQGDVIELELHGAIVPV